jgi:hypothetical protein
MAKYKKIFNRKIFLYRIVFFLIPLDLDLHPSERYFH